LDVNGDIYKKGHDIFTWGYKEGPVSWNSAYKNNWDNGGGSGGDIDCTSNSQGCIINYTAIYEVDCYQRANGTGSLYVGLGINGDRSAIEGRSNSMWTHDHSEIDGKFSESHYIGKLSSGELVTCGPPDTGRRDRAYFGSDGYRGVMKIKRVK
jgi:hypothetical protein